MIIYIIKYNILLIQFIELILQEMRIVIYCRISSVKQKNNSSFSLQFNKCMTYIREKYQPSEINKHKLFNEICSAYNKNPNILSQIINKKNTVIVMSNVNRFSRSVHNGKIMLNQCIKNNNTIIFVDNDIIFNSNNQINDVVNFIKIAEMESDIISQNVKNIKRYHNNINRYNGGGIQYGYSVIDNILVENEKEIPIFKFIIFVKSNIGGINIKTVINFIKNNSKINNTEKINNVIKSFNQHKIFIKPSKYNSNKIYLSYKNICDLFNKCGIKYRGNRWTTIKIKQIIKNKNILKNKDLNKLNLNTEKKIEENVNNDWDFLPLFKQFKKKCKLFS